MKKQGSGWKGESRRHSLARKGVKTARGMPRTKTFKAPTVITGGFGTVLDDLGEVTNKLIFHKTPKDQINVLGNYHIDWIALDEDGEIIFHDYMEIWTDGKIVKEIVGVDPVPKEAFDLLKERGFDVSKEENFHREYYGEERYPKASGIPEKIQIISNPLTIDFKDLKKKKPYSYAYYELQDALERTRNTKMEFVNQDDNYVYVRFKNKTTGKQSPIFNLSYTALKDMDSMTIVMIDDDIGRLK